MYTVGTALDHVRAILRDMSVEDRREAILRMPQSLRMVLLSFMQGWPSGSPVDQVPAAGAADVLEKKKKRKGPDAPAGAQPCAHVHAISAGGRTRFRVAAKFKGVNFYTREHFAEDVALHHQRTLTRMLVVLFDLEASAPRGWQGVASDACHAVLSEAGTPEGALGLCAYIRLRAHKHLGRHAVVTSPADSLCRTFETHRRLSHARDTSWNALRSEWLQLLQVHTGVSANAAAHHIDSVRRAKLRGEFAATLQDVDRALARRRDRPSG